MITELEAINVMLTSVGQLPIGSVDIPLPTAVAARHTLSMVNKVKQSYGWWFNEEQCVTLTRLLDNTIVLPQGCTRVELIKERPRGVQRGTKLYDAYNNTFIWDVDPVADLVIELPFEELSPIFQPYVMYAAASQFQANREGDQLKYQDVTFQLNEAELNVNRERTRWQNNNHKQNPTYQKYMSRKIGRGRAINPIHAGG